MSMDGEKPEVGRNMPEPWIDTIELARRLVVSETTVRSYLQRGLLPHVRIGRLVRFRWHDVR